MKNRNLRTSYSSSKELMDHVESLGLKIQVSDLLAGIMKVQNPKDYNHPITYIRTNGWYHRDNSKSPKTNMITIARLELTTSDPTDNTAGVILRKDTIKQEFIVHYFGKDGSYFCGDYVKDPEEAMEEFYIRLGHLLTRYKALYQ